MTQTYVNKTLSEKDKANIAERKAREDVAMRERLIATVKEDKKRVERESEVRRPCCCCCCFSSCPC